MLKIASILFPIIATTVMGIAVIGVLTVDMRAGVTPILWAALAAFVVSIPLSWLIARQIPGVKKNPE